MGTKIVIGKRGAGKSTYMLLRSSELQIPILACHRKYAETFENDAARMGLSIPKPLVIQDLIARRRQGEPETKVLIDDAEYILDLLLKKECGVRVEELTTTPTHSVSSRHVLCELEQYEPHLQQVMKEQGVVDDKDRKVTLLRDLDVWS